jgi:N-acetylmuramoyl-L-alanine amidase
LSARFLLLSILTPLILKSNDQVVWVKYTVKEGDNAAFIFNRYQLHSETDKEKFFELNQIKNRNVLIKDKTYLLPIREYVYNGQNIRSTIGINDYNHALRIQQWNEKLEQSRIKSKNIKSDLVLWVRFSDLNPQSPAIHETKYNFPSPSDLIDLSLFPGQKDKIKVEDTSLIGCVYYLISGHGGPDPGANIMKDGHFLCEDEYAYDVTLRLAKELVKKGAKVYMIVQDKTHGIRDDKYLKQDKTETVIGNKTIPLNHINRLNQRTEAVNRLYLQNRKKYKWHRCIEIHIDSRSKKEQIDVFFYHLPGSSGGQQLSEKLLKVFEEKYDFYQKGRGYNGEIKTRTLYTLVHTQPVAVYAELGNIMHQRDQNRILIPENRELLAKWMAEAMVRDRKKAN